jgi:ribonuclease VapC
LVEANKDLTLQAAQFKAFNKMSFADCFAAALAMKKKCELLTGDKEFKHVEGKIKIKWMR